MVYLDTLKKRHGTLIAMDETKMKPGRLESHRREIERLSRQIQTMTPRTVTVKTGRGESEPVRLVEVVAEECDVLPPQRVFVTLEKPKTPPTVTVYARIEERKTDTQKQWQAKGRKRATKKKAARKIRKGAHS